MQGAQGIRTVLSTKRYDPRVPKGNVRKNMSTPHFWFNCPMFYLLGVPALDSLLAI